MIAVMMREVHLRVENVCKPTAQLRIVQDPWPHRAPVRHLSPLGFVQHRPSTARVATTSAGVAPSGGGHFLCGRRHRVHHPWRTPVFLLRLHESNTEPRRTEVVVLVGVVVVVVQSTHAARVVGAKC